MQNKTIIFIIGIVIVTGIGFFVAREKQAPTTLFDMAFEDYAGNIVSLSDFKEKQLVVNSWAAWCPFCKEELVDFAAAQEEFGDAVTIIAVDRAESLQTAKEFTDSVGITDSLLFLLDPNDSFYRAIGGFSMPETIFVNKDGNIVEHKRGPMELNEIRQKIQTLISL